MKAMSLPASFFGARPLEVADVVAEEADFALDADEFLAVLGEDFPLLGEDIAVLNENFPLLGEHLSVLAPWAGEAALMEKGSSSATRG